MSTDHNKWTRADKDALYEELLDRIHHIENAFIVRRHIKLHSAKNMPAESTNAYRSIRCKYNGFFHVVEEATLWFITVELWSRFTRNSKRGLRRFVEIVSDKELNNMHSELLIEHEAVVEYINTQRSQYFVHADEVDWKDFPNIFDSEYEALIKDTKKVLNKAGAILGSQRLSSGSNRAAQDTISIFDDLLRTNEPNLDVYKLTEIYKKGVDEFVRDQKS